MLKRVGKNNLIMENRNVMPTGLNLFKDVSSSVKRYSKVEMRGKRSGDRDAQCKKNG